MAEGFCLSAASNAVGTLMVDYLVKPIERRLRYLFRFHKIVQELRRQENTLSIEQTQLNLKVEEAKLQTKTQVIEEYVDEWLRNAANAISDVESLKLRIEENKRCFRWCPNWSWRYRLSREIEMKTLDITALLEKSKLIEIVGHRAKLPGLEFVISKDLVASKSSTAAFNEIMEILKDDTVNVIGVLGMGGVGKTTLVTKVGKRAEELQLFGSVIKVVVSQTPNIEYIQHKIADFLHLKFEKTTQEGKAEELCLRLQNEKKVLIILDDLWKKLNLKKIGVRFGEDGKGCKIILTTGRRMVCESMECQVTVPVDVLDEDEAWTLFKMNAGLETADPDITEEAKKVAKECKGLPIAIVTLAGALKGTEAVKGWEVARKKLESSRLMEIGDGEEEEEKNAYMCLELSYDYLQKEETKRCFLLCALYPEDHSIVVEDLVRHAWGLELYGKATSIAEVRYEVLGAIKSLKDSYLLLGDEDEEEQRHIKLHDMVRDVAVWITSKEESGFMIKSNLGLLNENFEPCTAISMLDNEEKDFPEGLLCSKLKILLLNNCDTPVACFEGMQELKVLSLAEVGYSMRIFSLNALTSLRELRALHLENFTLLMDFLSLGKLTTLEILNLSGSKIQGFSDEFGNLKNLKVLDLTNCGFLSRFPHNLIRNFCQLEELYLNGSDINMIEETSGSGEASNGILPELNFLTKLEALYLEVPSYHLLKDFKFPELDRYEISIYSMSDYRTMLDRYPIRSRNKRIGCYRAPINKLSLEIEGFPLNVLSKLLSNMEVLDVSQIMDEYVECFTDRKQQKVPASLILQHLKEVRIENCENLKVIFQMAKVEENGAPLLSRLRQLFLHNLSDLSCIWELPTQHVSLERLVNLRLSNCPRLKSLFSFSLAQSLVLLQYLKIDRCRILEQIVTELEGDEEEISSSMNPHTSLCFPKLTSLQVTNCGDLEYIFPTMVAPQGLQQMTELKMENCYQLKQVLKPAKEMVGREIELRGLQFFTVINCPQLTNVNAHLESVKVDLTQVRLSTFKGLLCNTKDLTLHQTMDHKNLIPDALLEGLTSLRLKYCKDIECLVDTTQEHGPTSGIFSNLENLELQGLPKLRWILKGPTHYVSLQSLKVVIIMDCTELKSLFSLSVVPTLKLLEELKIVSCDISGCFFTESESDDDQIEPNSLCLPNLKTLEIERCPKLEYVFPLALARGFPCLQKVILQGLKTLSSFIAGNNFVEAPALEILDVDQCPRLMNFILQKEVNKCVPLKKLTIDFKECIDDAESCHMVNTQLGQRSPNLEYITLGNFEHLFLLQGGNFISGLKDIWLTNLIWLRDIWKGPIQIATNLRELKIYECNGLTYIFPVMLIRSLPHLCYLSIMRCKKLEQIIANDDTLASSSSQGHDQDEMGVVKKGKEMLMFPQLEILHLKKLASIVSFSSMGYHFVFPSLDSLEIKECPQLITSFTVDSTLMVHAKTKEEDTRLECSTTTQQKDDIKWSKRNPTSLPPYMEEPLEISPLK